MTAYLVGALLALGVAAFAAVVGLDRDRAFYPTVMIVIASYYALFALMAGSTAALAAEAPAIAFFIGLAVLGFRASPWFLVAAMAGHGLFDFFRGDLILNPGVPAWWPMFCMAFDVMIAAVVAWQLLRSARRAPKP
jgi:hypothetical protein